MTTETEWWKRYRPKSLGEMMGQTAAVRQLNEFLRKKAVPHALAFTGPSGCLRGDMPIYDPEENLYLTVKERFRRGVPFQVLCLNEQTGRVERAWAKPPVRYSSDKIYRILTSDGAVFYVTGGHQMRLASGEYAQVSSFAERRPAFADIRLLTTSAHGRSVHAEDGLRSSEKDEDSTVCYPAYTYSGDERLLSEEGTAPAFSPSQDGAQGRIRPEQTGEWGGGFQRTRRRSLGGLPSTQDSSPSASTYDPPSKSSSSEGMPAQLSLDTRKIRQSPSESFRPDIQPEHLHPVQATGIVFSRPNLVHGDKFPSAWVPPKEGMVVTAWASIKEVIEVGQEEYYDFHVPGWNNYWMGGVFHHNCGKTTAARILAKDLGCADLAYREVNASSDRGIDMVRDIQSGMGMAPMRGKIKMFVLDECHALPKASQEAMLKTLEDTPRHVYFILCTSEPGKLIPAVKTRCTEVKFDKIKPQDLSGLIQSILAKENAKGSLSQDLKDRLIEASDGSARKCLVLLEQVVQAKDEEEAEGILQAYGEKSQGWEIARCLHNPRSQWKDAAKLIRELSEDAEGVRRVTLAWAEKVVLGGGGQAERAARILDKFQYPFHETGRPALTLAVYQFYHEGE